MTTIFDVRDRAIAKLEADPNLHRAMVADDSGNPIRIGLAIRGIGAAELLLPAGKYDGINLLELWQARVGGSA